MSFPEKVKKIFVALQEKHDLPEKLADELSDIEFCKRHKLQTQFPVLRKRGESEFDASGKNRRYYPFSSFGIIIHGKDYILTNNWYKKDASLIKSFFSKYLSVGNIEEALVDEVFYNQGGGDVADRRNSPSKWPEWEFPSLQDVKTIAHLLTPYLKFLKPEIVEKITESNIELKTYFKEYLGSCGIDTKYYYWDGCSTMFPGIRRANGKTDNEFKKKQLPIGLRAEKNAIYIDDNSYPKHIWAIIFTGQQFSNKGPNGYELAHIFEHKSVGRVSEELSYDSCSDYELSIPLSGMFTSAAGLMYSPRSFVKITDHSLETRRLIQNKVVALYKDVTNVLPPSCSLEQQNDEWSINSFEWGEPVGDISKINQFLEYRKERLDKILNLEIPKK